jgi:hypothetical protein
MSHRVPIAGGVGAILVALLWTGFASAATINFAVIAFSEGAEGTPTTVDYAPNPFPFSVSRTDISAESVRLDITVPNLTASTPRTAVAALIEPGTRSNPVISDLLFVTKASGVITVEFQSDDGAPLDGAVAGCLIEENGGAQKMFTIRNVPLDGSTVDITIYARSDLDDATSPAQEVPEPGTVLLLGSGLLGLVAICRRLRRS